jgi:transcriptional regulator with XRE-family HTH domain
VFGFSEPEVKGLCVQVLRNAKERWVPYNLIVLDWYLKDWLKATGTTQADLVRLTDYPKAKVSDLVTGKQRYNRDILNDVSQALHVTPAELLMHPEDAMALRQLRASARAIVRVPYGGTAGETDEPATLKKSA